MFDWEEGDRFSFEDSDRFEEDSLCSWISEPESLCNNWRGWKRQNGNNNVAGSYHATFIKNKDGQILSLGELSARVVACHIPFEVVERVYPPVPELLQLRIAFWSFPENEEDIRLYSCLANGSADEFQRGEHLFKARAVKDLLQIGFHLSATVTPPPTLGVSKGSCNVAVTFDRRRITKCNCTCGSNASWCAHVVAVCLYRIHQPTHVRLRAPVSESLSQLRRDQLLKFAQYLISELPQQILPTAQRLLDELLSSQQTAINATHGAPDPTAGASANEQTTWCLDESTLHDNIHKILIKLCAPSPIVYSDVNYLSSTAPPAAAEWSSLLRPLRGREPEGMWNLLSIVREMLRRSDSNAIPLLEILTDEVLSCDQILVWWFNTKVSLHMGSGGHGGRGSVHSNTHASQHACSSLCDELVVLWRLAALNPALSSQDRQALLSQLCSWHVKTLERVWKTRSGGSSSGTAIKRADIDVFSGFRPAMEACLLDWNDYPISGVTYHEGGGRRWYSSYVHARFNDHYLSGESSEYVSMKRGRSVDISHSGGWRLVNERKHLHGNNQTHHCALNQDGKNSSNRSSLSSEGFCENEQEVTEAVEENPIKTWTRTFVSRTNSSHRSSFSRCHSSFLDNVNQSLETENNIVQKKKVSDDYTKRENESSFELQNQHDCRLLPEKSGDASESQQSSDEYQLYYYDPRQRIPSPEHVQEYMVEEERFSVSVKKIDDPFEILFARAEALHAHGHTKEACRLAVRLAEELLAHPPNLMVELPPPPTRGKRVRRFNPACHQISLLASATLAKVAFLCSVLGENTDHHHLAFRVGLFGLEMARPPASTKALEVKLVNQEQDLVLLLKRLPLTDAELKIVCERADQLRDGHLVSRGDALLPLMLASYIFDALVLSGRSIILDNGKSADEFLGFEAAVAALGLKANVSEAEHPLLCEGTRRQRGELAISLLVHYKDDQEKLAKIMDKLLDKDVHQMYKAPPLSTYYSSCNQPVTEISSGQGNEDHGLEFTCPPEIGSPQENEDIETSISEDFNIPDVEGNQVTTLSVQEVDGRNKRSVWQMHRGNEDLGDRSEGASSPGWEEDYKAWEAKFRCTNFRTTKKHSRGMASIDSSAPETTSSDNSPTVVRRSTWVKSGGPGSDSGSSGESSDSFASSSSDDKVPRTKARETESLPQVMLTTRFSSEGMARSGTPSVKIARFKGKRSYPNVPNQPSEASAHFMFELAKTVLTKAGGNSSTAVLFTQPSAGQNHRGPHRALHMCAFQIGLYALGLHNAVSPNWLSRTYSSHVSWITGQAMEIGSSAINFLIETWEGHLTPPEVASLADRASRGRDPAMVRAAAELALSCLPHAHALNPNEIQRALIQCKEQSSEMLERACLAVESAAKGGGVYPEVLFDVARKWYELYEESLEDRHNDGLSETVTNNVDSENLTDMVSSARTDHGTLATHNLHVGQVEGVITTAPSVQVIPQLACPPVTYTLAYPTAPYGYMQSVTPFPHSPMPLHAAYVPSPAAYPYGALTNLSYYTPSATSTTHLRHSTPGLYTNQVVGVPVSRAQSVLPLGSHAVMAAQSPPTPAIPSQQPQMQNPISQLNQQQMGYLLAAYRVGMLAMETLARRVHDDRPQAKYARNPPYGEDVKWLLNVAKKLGTSYLQEFCICTVNSVASPFILHEIVLEAGHYLARSASTPLPTPMRSHLLTPLIQKCQQMFIACTHFKMYHITPGEYEEFVNIIRSARSAFQLTPGGMVQFNELLQSLRRSKSCKKELWQRIANSLATGSI